MANIRREIMNWLGPTLAIIAIAAGVATMFAVKWAKEGRR